jgi:hypothetical protein
MLTTFVLIPRNNRRSLIGLQRWVNLQLIARITHLKAMRENFVDQRLTARRSKRRASLEGVSREKSEQ